MTARITEKAIADTAHQHRGYFTRYRYKVEFKRWVNRLVDEAWDTHFSGSSEARLIKSRPRRLYVSSDADLVLIKLRLHDQIMRIVDSVDNSQ